MRGRGLRESRWDSAEMVFAGLMPDYMYLIVATADLEKHGPYYYPFQEGMRRLSGCRGKPLLYSLSNYSYSKPMQPIGYLLLPRRHQAPTYVLSFVWLLRLSVVMGLHTI